MSEGMDFSPELRDMFRGLIFLEIKKAESNNPPGLSLAGVHEAISRAGRDAYGTKTQAHQELQSMVAEGLIYEVGKDLYRVVPGAKPPGKWSGPGLD